MFETTLLGAGTYPEPPEPKEKCYQFDFNATISIYGSVYAESEEEVKEMIEKGKYKVIFDDKDIEIDDKDIEIEKIEKY